jgi:ABC-type oligopeptide transport system substrate-binding subunit
LAYPDVIDPQRSAPGNGLEILRLTYEGLLSIDEKGNIGQGSADRWKLSEDGTSMTFHIRDDLKRVDGTPITARDFEYALKRAVDPRVPGKVVSYILDDVKGAEDLDRIDPAKAKPEEIEKALANYGVKAMDDRTLVVTFKGPFGYWEFVAATQVTYPSDRKQIDKDPDNWWTKPEGHNGNGPFKIKSIDPGKKIVLLPHENYWRGKPKLDRIELMYYADAKTALDAYRKGDIDLLANVAPDDLAAINTDATMRAELLRYPVAITYALAFNSSRKPFDD